MEDAEEEIGLGDIEGYSYSSEDVSSSSDRATDFHPTAGKTYGKGRTVLQDIDDKDKYKTERRSNVYFLFMSRQDFEMGAWLSQSNASSSQIDDFLRLSYVYNNFPALNCTPLTYHYRLRNEEVSLSGLPKSSIRS